MITNTIGNNSTCRVAVRTRDSMGYIVLVEILVLRLILREKRTNVRGNTIRYGNRHVWGRFMYRVVLWTACACSNRASCTIFDIRVPSGRIAFLVDRRTSLSIRCNGIGEKPVKRQINTFEIEQRFSKETRGGAILQETLYYGGESKGAIGGL